MKRVFLMLDANADIFFQRQLEEIDKRLFETKYGALEALQLVQAKPLHPGAESYTWRRYDSRGQAKIMSNYATASPRANVNGVEETSKVKSVRAHYGYNVQEIRAASMTGVPLDPMNAMAARRMVDETLNTIGLLGDAEFNLIGLFNQPNAQTYTVPTDGTGSSAEWADKTSDQILRDLFGLLEQVYTTTKEIERPKRILMPYPHLRFIQQKKLSSAGDGTLSVFEYFKAKVPDVEVRGALYLDTAGAGSTARMMAYDPNPMNQEWLVPIPFETFETERVGLEYKTECHARVGGVVCRYPLSMIYGDGI
jgi:hypothetical protein